VARVPSADLETRRLPWRTRAAVGSVVALAAALVVSLVPIVRDVVVLQPAEPDRIESHDAMAGIAGSEIAMTRALSVTGVIVVAAAVVALGAAAVALATGRSWGRPVAIAGAIPWLLCCGWASFATHGAGATECLGPACPTQAGRWLTTVGAIGTTTSFVMAALTIGLLVGAASRRQPAA